MIIMMIIEWHLRKNGKGKSNLQNRDFICLPAHMFLPSLGILQQKDSKAVNVNQQL